MVGKWILTVGIVLIVVGTVGWLVEGLGLPLGRQLSNIRMRGQGWSFSFPIVISIVLSLLLNLILWLFWRP